MKKDRRNFFTRWLIYSAIVIICWIVLTIVLIWNRQSDSVLNTLKTITAILLCAPLLVFELKFLGGFIKGCIEGINRCGDPLFDEMATYHAIGEGSSKHYQEILKAINFYYKENGKVDRVVKKDLKRLYRRLEFLNRSIASKQILTTSMSAVGFSVAATILIDLWKIDDGPVAIIGRGFGLIAVFMLSMISIFGKVFLETSTRVWEYEKGLLMKKIEEAEKTDAIGEYHHESIMITKRNVVKCLNSKSWFTWGKKLDAIQADIDEVVALELDIDDMSQCTELPFTMGRKNIIGCLYLDQEGKLVNAEYEKLYNILRKYNWGHEISQ